jgi:predicted transcriptional regulator
MGGGPKSRLRRVGAAILTAGLAVLLAGAIAVVQPPAADAREGSEPTPELPHEFQLPTPNVGDRGTFAAQAGDGSERILVDFEWLPDATLRGTDGVSQTVNALRYVHHAFVPTRGEVLQERLVFFEAGTATVVATQTGGTWGTDEAGSALRGNKTTTVFGQDTTLPPLLCGLRNALQGHRLALPAPVELGRGCTVLNLSAPDGTVRLAPDALGVSTQAQRDLVRTTALDAPNPTHIWLASDVPYPVRFEADGASQVVRLAAFERGTVPVASDSGPRTPVAGLDLQPTLPWGLNDSYAADHPWPLSAAYEWMMGESAEDPVNPAPSDVPDFLKAHPGAFLYYARYTESVNNVHSTYVWDVAFTDGRDSLRRCAVHEIQHWVRQVAYTGTVLDQGNYEANMFDNSCPSEKPNELTPYPPGPPATMPTLASLAERWRLHAGPGFEARSANAWSFEVLCSDWACQHTGVRIGVGYLRDAHFDYSKGLVASPVQPAENGFAYSALRLNETGQALWLDESSEWRGDRSRLSLPLAADDPPGARALPPSKPQAAAPVAPWKDPIPIAVTGLAVVAVGLGFCFWSLLQGAVVAAFSRLQKDHAALHPTRAALLELLEANPGLHLQEIRRRLNLANGPVIHHLEKLVRVGLLTTVTAPGYTCYFPKGKVDYRVMTAAPSLKAEAARRLLFTLNREPSLSIADLGQRTQLSPRIVGYHLGRLRDSGLVEIDEAGSRFLVRPTPLGSETIGLGLCQDPASPGAEPRPETHP